MLREGRRRTQGEAYEKLVRVTRSSLTQAKRVGRALRERADERSRRLADKLDHYVPLIEQGIDQAVRRVLREEQVPAAEKILSLFEDHTMIITRRKVGKPREYGRKVLIDEVEGGIISRYEVLSEAGREHPHLPESIEGHRERFGRAPELLSADRGLYSKANEEAAKKAGIRRVALPHRVAALRRSEKSTNSSSDGSGEPSRSERASKGGSACSGGNMAWSAVPTMAKTAWAGGSAGG